MEAPQYDAEYIRYLPFQGMYIDMYGTNDRLIFDDSHYLKLKDFDIDEDKPGSKSSKKSQHTQ